MIKNIDAFEFIANLADGSVDACITDPPYFIDGLGDEWNRDNIEELRTSTTGHIRSLPKGMKFDVEQGKRFQEFMNRLAPEIYRVLKPGGAFVSFSQARLYHRMTVGVEDAGFEIRDMLGWTYEGQAKAFSMDHIIAKQKWTDKQKADALAKTSGWKTPQLKPMIEPMCFAQKPVEGKFLDNFLKYGTGLINTEAQWQDKFPGNIILCPKPSKREKGDYNDHVSVKPLELMKHLIEIFTQPNGIVLDPFLGSGTTAVAAQQIGRDCWGSEIDPHYYTIIQRRLATVTPTNNLFDFS
jgi:site-specific DNA-methyltransferase (adenine-specific)